MVAEKIGGNFHELIVAYCNNELDASQGPLAQIDSLGLFEETLRQARLCEGDVSKLQRLWVFGMKMFTGDFFTKSK